MGQHVRVRACALLLGLGAACYDGATPPPSGPGLGNSGGSTGSNEDTLGTTSVVSASASGASMGTESDDSTTTGDVDDSTTVGDTLTTTGDEITATTGESTTGGGCPGGCDDGVDCTDDACVSGACVNTPMDALCDDSIACTTDACDEVLDCIYTPVDAMCNDGIACTDDACDETLGCIAPANDSLCDDGVPCTTNTCDTTLGCQYPPDDAACDDGVDCTDDTCDALLDCQYSAEDSNCDDGDFCTTGSCDTLLDCQYSGSVLVFNGSNGTATTPEDAVTALGYTPIVTTDEAGFNAAYDAGGFDAIVVDIASVFTPIPAAMQMRLDTWVSSNERLIFAFWDLDFDASMQTTLGVTVAGSVDPVRPVHTDPASPVDFFSSLEVFPSPITYSDYWADNGDEISPSGAGFIAARFTDGMVGPGAIVVTHSDRVVTNGFMAVEVGQSLTDGDMDGINDGEELLRNELDYICGNP